MRDNLICKWVVECFVYHENKKLAYVSSERVTQ